MRAAWILRTVRRQAERHRLTVLAAGASFFLLALLAGTTRLGARVVARWGGLVGQNVHLLVYLGDEMDEETSRDLAEILRRAPTVAQVAMVEPTQAFARFKTSALSFGADGKTLETLEPSYFPRSIEVRLIPAPDLGARADDLAKRLRGVPGVVQVDAMGTGLARLSAWSSFGKRLGTGALIALALLDVVALVAVFVRLRTALARRAAVLVQLGETTTGIRLPSGLWMAAAAAIGGAVAATTLSLGWQPLVGRIERSLGMLGSSSLPALGGAEVATGLAVLVALGLAFGYFATPVPESDSHG
jgi:cell division protein FtsX